MFTAKANNIEIKYETFGNPSSEPILLIARNSAKIFYYRKEFYTEIAQFGFWVIIYLYTQIIDTVVKNRHKKE